MNFKQKAFSKFLTKRNVLLIAIVAVLVAALTVCGSIAYLQKTANALTNSFSAAGTPTPTITETFDKTTKEHVKVALSNSGSGKYFVRATVTFTLLDEDGNISPKVPVAGTDYTISMGPDWTKDGDFWYYKEAIAPNSSTNDLIVSCTTLNTTQKLEVDIVAQTIQSVPTTAAQSAWGYVPGNN